MKIDIQSKLKKNCPSENQLSVSSADAADNFMKPWGEWGGGTILKVVWPKIRKKVAEVSR